MSYTTSFDSQWTGRTRQARRALYSTLKGLGKVKLKQAASPFGRIGPSPATHARPLVARPWRGASGAGACAGRVSGRVSRRVSGAGKRVGKRARAHGADDGQVEQRADQRHVAQEAEGNREEVAAG